MPEGSRLRRNPDVSWRSIDGQAVLIHNREGEIQVLNEIGTYIWEHLEEDELALARNIVREYEVTLDEALGDLREFIGELKVSGAVVEEVRPDGDLS